MTVSEEISKLEQQRRQRLKQLQDLGIDPYGSRCDDLEPAQTVKDRFQDGDDTQRAKCAGRIVLLRDIGKLIFLTLRDRSGTIQIGLSKKMLGASNGCHGPQICLEKSHERHSMGYIYCESIGIQREIDVVPKWFNGLHC